MSVVPSIILSAVLSCGGIPANVQGAVNSSCSGGVTYYENICDLRNALSDMGVDFCADIDCGSLNEFLNAFLGECGNNQSAPAPEAPTDAPAPPPETSAPAEAPSVPVPPQATQAPSTDNSYAYQVIELVNQERVKYGLAALAADETLMNAAQKRAAETVTSFSHTRPNGASFSSVLSEYGVNYRTAGENIAYGQRTPQEVVNAWMNSSGHRANILNSKYTKIGVGCYKSGSTYYWSQLFTG